MSSNEKFHMRLAAEPDAKCIVGIVKQSFVQYCATIGINTIEALRENEQDVLSDMMNKHVYVAYWDGAPVGSIRVEIGNDKATVSRFAILPEYQGLGIGSEILAFVEKALVNMRVTTVELYSAVDNIRLKEFYVSKGYCVVSIDDSKGYRRGLFRKAPLRSCLKII